MANDPNHSGAHAPPHAAAHPVGARSRPGRRHAALVALGVLAAALLGAGIVPRLRAGPVLDAQTRAQTTLSVEVITPRVAPATRELLLPGAVTAFADASVFARTNGYLARWYTDIGTHVSAGETLAVIKTPELDAQLRQARADRQTAQANFDYASVTAARWRQMMTTQSVSQQEVDTKVSDLAARRAMLAAAQANVARLAELVSYEKVVAPFDGTVTARNVDVGALVSAGGAERNAGAPSELFHLAQTDRLRVFVDVPQGDAPYAVPGSAVYLTAQQYPGRHFLASVARNSGAIDPVSRTLRVEVDVDNRDGALLPGAYAQVHLLLRSASPALDVPVNALLFRPGGPAVAVVGPDGKVALKTVHIGRDFGTHMEITAGLAATDRVIDNPGDALSAGQTVQIAQSAQPPQPATQR